MEKSIVRHRGVVWDKAKNKWMATIKIDGKNKFLGYFTDHSLAVEARLKVEPIYREPKKKARELFEKKICDLYVSGETMEKIGEKVGLNGSSIWEILKKNKIQSRSNLIDIDTSFVANEYLSGKTLSEISHSLGVSPTIIADRLNDLSVPTRKRKFKIDETLFDEIDDEWKAYYLGLLMADGCVMKHFRVVTISLTILDSYIIDPFAQRLYGNCDRIFTNKGGPRMWKSNGRTYFSKDYRRINVCSKKICKALGKWGCNPAKSLTLEWPTNLPKNMYSHFFRGFFDGDGHISKPGISAMIITSNAFCVGASKHLQEEWGIHSVVKKAGKVSRLFVWRKEDLRKLKDIMYKDATISLKRKRDRFI